MSEKEPHRIEASLGLDTKLIHLVVSQLLLRYKMYVAFVD